MKVRQSRARTSATAALAAALLHATAAWAQGGADASGPPRIDAIQVEITGDAVAGETRRRLEADVRRALAHLQGRAGGQVEVDIALAALQSRGLAAGASARYEIGPGGTVALVVEVSPRTAPAAAPNWTDGLKLVDDGRHLLKIRLGLKGAMALSGNQWFDNGATLTKFNPRGRFDGGRGPNGIVDLAPSIGLAGATPLGSGADPAYLYASALYLGTLSLGQDNNRADVRHTGQWEEAFVGIVDAGTTASGLPWRANLSWGRQTYCIGNGMLLCQIASSGGDRGADFGWPRWSGENFLKAQLRVDRTLVEAFQFEPNDFPSSQTRIAGLNVEHDAGGGLTAGMTWLTAREGQLRYYLPDGQSWVREGLRAWHLRAALKPAGADAGLIAKAEYAQQTHADFDMRATGYSAEAGWQFGGSGWRPSVTWRYSVTTGDDPATPRYERWDLLYSGNDIDTWVQGQLMKNIHYNSNVQVHRVLARATPAPRWRLTGAVSTYRADTLNNIGGVISTLAGHRLGSELLLVAEHFVSRHVYWRFTAASLWPGSGVTRTLPEPAARPWLVGIAQFNLSY